MQRFSCFRRLSDDYHPRCTHLKTSLSALSSAHKQCGNSSLKGVEGGKKTNFKGAKGFCFCFRSRCQRQSKATWPCCFGSEVALSKNLGWQKQLPCDRRQGGAGPSVYSKGTCPRDTTSSPYAAPLPKIFIIPQ